MASNIAPSDVVGTVKENEHDVSSVKHQSTFHA